MIPLAGTCRLSVRSRRISAIISPMQIRRVKPASQLHASRVCLVYIKPILDPRKWQVSALWPNAASEPSSRPVPAMRPLCRNLCYMASHKPIFKGRTAKESFLGIHSKNGTGSRARTYDLRFWRPPLYQLSYARMRMSAQQALPKSFRALCKERRALPSLHLLKSRRPPGHFPSILWLLTIKPTQGRTIFGSVRLTYFPTSPFAPSRRASISPLRTP